MDRVAASGSAGRQAGTASVGVIDIRVEDVSQLFETMDPFPFRERDLAGEADAYIFDSARELPRTAALAIVVHLPESAAASPSAQSLDTAVHRFFAYREEVVARELSALFRIGRKALAIGMAVLAFCIIIGQALSTVFESGYIAHTFKEGLIILGWVANWRPMEIFLYDWWPIVQRRNIYRRLMRATVTIKTYEPPR